MKFFLTIAFVFLSYSTLSAQQSKETAVRYGESAPRPTTYEEAALELGNFKSEIKRLGSGNINYVCKGTLVFGGTELAVVIKPDSRLKDTGHEGIYPLAGNRNADAAYQVSRFISLVETPAHVIRDDAPVPSKNEETILTEEYKTESRGGAGIQIFIEGLARNTDEIKKQIQSSPELLLELEEIAVFDCLIGNRDRNIGNWAFRKKTGKDERHIVAIDHSVAFPERSHTDQEYQAEILNLYLESERKGKISESTILKLKELLRKRGALDKILRLNLGHMEIDMFWWRLEKMLRDKRVFLP